MSKDIAALFIIDKWFLATKEMKADCRGWYLNLILHQYDKTDLPNDIEELANLADVRMSEFEQFKQVFEQVLKHKFVQNSNGRLENEFAKGIIKSREMFKQKRSDAGKLSYVLKYFRSNFKYKKGFEDFVKSNIDLNFDTKNEQMLEQVFKQMSELYINVNVIINKDIVTYPNQKIEYAPAIFLTEEENKRFIEELGDEKTKIVYKYLSDWGKEKPSKFREYKDHNLAIRRWVIDAVEKKYPNLIKSQETKAGKVDFKIPGKWNV